MFTPNRGAAWQPSTNSSAPFEWAIPAARAPVLLAMASAAVAVWLGWSLLEANFTHLFFLEHAGANLILGLIFGRTLVGNSEPLCTRFARLIHGSLLPDVALYTRRVTLAWTIFFFMLFAVSCALYLGGFLEAWSILANIASPLLVATMFAVEYAVRLRAWSRSISTTSC